jgi:hypothetical protein
MSMNSFLRCSFSKTYTAMIEFTGQFYLWSNRAPIYFVIPATFVRESIADCVLSLMLVYRVFRKDDCDA